MNRQQDWLWGLVGGGLIGTGGAVYLFGNGWITGASGIIGGLVDGTGRHTAIERLVLLAAVALMPVLLTPFYNVAIGPHLTTNWNAVVVAGLLFGVGWGLVGPCPGSAIASLSHGGTGNLVFLAAILPGMAVAPKLGERLDRLAEAA